MILFRFLLLAFNVAVIGFLIYRLLYIAKVPMERYRKVIIIISGIILLLTPLGMFFRFIGPSAQYFLIYPLAIAMFLYLTKSY